MHLAGVTVRVGRTVIAVVTALVLLAGCNAPSAPVPGSDLRGRSDAELTALLPAKSEFPAFIGDFYDRESTGEPSEEPSCEGDPWGRLVPNFITVTSRLSGTRNMKVDDTFAVGVYRDRELEAGIELISNYLTRCPSWEYTSDFGSVIRVEYAQIDPPVTDRGKVLAYEMSVNSEKTGTYYLAGLRGLLVKTFFGPQVDAEVARKLFTETVDRVAAIS